MTGRQALRDRHAHDTATRLTEADRQLWTPAEPSAVAELTALVVDLRADKIRDEAPDVAERVSVVATGEEFDPGLPVTAVGEWHNVIHPELPRPHNSGYLVTVADQCVYHPGDALTEPGVPVDVLLCPSSAPWLRSEMAIDFVRAVGAPRNLAIHDRIYTDVAHGILQTQMDTLVGPCGQEWLLIPDGTDL